MTYCVSISKWHTLGEKKQNRNRDFSALPFDSMMNSFIAVAVSETEANERGSPLIGRRTHFFETQGIETIMIHSLATKKGSNC